MAAEFPQLRHVVVAGEPAAGQTALAAHLTDALPSQDAIDALLQSVRPDRRGRRDDAALGRHHVAVRS